jgi:predicted kinase
MATAHLIHGYLGAGKTTFAKQLEVNLPAMRLSHDEWMAGLFGEDPPEASFADQHRRVWAVMTPVWTRALALGCDVVLDFGFWRRSERDSVRDQAAALGAEVRLYEVVCPEAEAWNRVECRNGALDGSLLITRNTFDVLRARFEPLDPDEERLTIQSGRA